MLLPTLLPHLGQVCLLDNITEHLDVIRAFQLMLHRKRGRLGKSNQRLGSHCTYTVKTRPQQSRNPYTYAQHLSRSRHLLCSAVCEVVTVASANAAGAWLSRQLVAIWTDTPPPLRMSSSQAQRTQQQASQPLHLQLTAHVAAPAAPQPAQQLPSDPTVMWLLPQQPAAQRRLGIWMLVASAHVTKTRSRHQTLASLL